MEHIELNFNEEYDDVSTDSTNVIIKALVDSDLKDW